MPHLSLIIPFPRVMEPFLLRFKSNSNFRQNALNMKHQPWISLSPQRLFSRTSRLPGIYLCASIATEDGLTAPGLERFVIAPPATAAQRCGPFSTGDDKAIQHRNG